MMLSFIRFVAYTVAMLGAAILIMATIYAVGIVFLGLLP